MGRRKKLSNMSLEEIDNLSVNDFAKMLAKETVDGKSNEEKQDMLKIFDEEIER